MVADALRSIDPVGARAADAETNWRSGYLTHFRRLVEAGLQSPHAALTIARDGLDSLQARMRFADDDGEQPVGALLGRPARHTPVTATVSGTAEPERELSLPYHGERLRGEDLVRRVELWAAAGIVEPSCVDAVRRVLDHPEWLALPGHTVVALGANAEIGPLRALLRWGATVAGIDLPNPAVWRSLGDLTRASAGTLLMPVLPSDDSADEVLRAGVDLVTDGPAAADWIGRLDGRLVLGNYVYADGGMNVRVSVAVDALTTRVLAGRDDVALGFLATPTDVFAIPGSTVARSVANYQGRSRAARLAGRPLRTVSGGRLMRRNYRPGADPGINDSLVPQQGPNYALAKRLQRWRAVVAREAGVTVSLNVAPPTRTKSVTKNRALAAAYAGAHRFGVEVFEPATCNVLMAALLVHDVYAGDSSGTPWEFEAHDAVHGGLWTTPYAPRSVLGLAALLGLGAARA